MLRSRQGDDLDIRLSGQTSNQLHASESAILIASQCTPGTTYPLHPLPTTITSFPRRLFASSHSAGHLDKCTTSPL